MCSTEGRMSVRRLWILCAIIGLATCAALGVAQQPVPTAAVSEAPAAAAGTAAAAASVETAAPKVSVTFLDLQAAKAAIVDDSAEPYFDKLQPLEMAAKTGSPVPGATLDEQRAECRRRYQAAVLEFSQKEKETLTWYVSSFQPILEKEYPLVARTSWSFIKLSDRIEGGLPHTRGPHIILGLRTLVGLSFARERFTVQGALSNAVVLVHEQLHVVQRAHPDLFAKLYTDQWGFQRAQNIEGCPWLVEHQILDPDAVDCGWVLPVKQEKGMKFIQPLVVLAKTGQTPAMPPDFRTIAVVVDPVEGGFRVRMGEGGEPVHRDLERVPEYVQKVFPAKESFHPAEAAAEIFATIFALDAFVPKGQAPPDATKSLEPVLSPLRQWFRENLK